MYFLWNVAFKYRELIFRQW